MDDSGTDLIVILSSDPLVGKRVETGQDRTTEPDGVFASGLVIDMNGVVAVLRPLHLIKFIPEAASQPIEERVASR